MSGATYIRHLQAAIAQAMAKPAPRTNRLTRLGYTYTSGAPIGTVIRLEGEKRWRRLWIWQTSNMGTCFVRVKGECLIVRGESLPRVTT